MTPACRRTVTGSRDYGPQPPPQAGPSGGSLYTSAMSRAVLERRLDALVARRRSLRDELAVVDEQLAALAEAAQDARLRSLVSETPVADVEHRDASRSADAM